MVKLGFIIRISHSRICLVSGEVKDNASVHVLTDDIDTLKKCVIDISSQLIVPNAEQMDYYGRKALERVFSVPGNDSAVLY